VQVEAKVLVITSGDVKLRIEIQIAVKVAVAAAAVAGVEVGMEYLAGHDLRHGV